MTGADPNLPHLAAFPPSHHQKGYANTSNGRPQPPCPVAPCQPKQGACNLLASLRTTRPQKLPRAKCPSSWSLTTTKTSSHWSHCGSAVLASTSCSHGTARRRSS